MSAETGEPGNEGLSVKVEEAERKLREAVEAAKAAEERTTAEIRTLEADLESTRLCAAEDLQKQRIAHEEALRNERDAKQQAIAAAESRLAEIETQTEAAEKRVEEAERRAAAAENATGDAGARAREGAAAWLRGQIEAIRREAGQR